MFMEKAFFLPPIYRLKMLSAFSFAKRTFSFRLRCCVVGVQVYSGIDSFRVNLLVGEGTSISSYYCGFSCSCLFCCAKKLKMSCQLLALPNRSAGLQSSISYQWKVVTLTLTESLRSFFWKGPTFCSNSMRMDLECVKERASELSSSWQRFFSLSLSAYWKLFLWLRVWFFWALLVEQALCSFWSKLKLRPNLGDCVCRRLGWGFMQLAVDLFSPLLEKTLEEQVLKEVSGVGASPAPPVPYRYSDSSRVLPAKSSLLPLMTKLGGESLFLSLLNYCSASSVIFSFLLLYSASRAISALCPIRHRGAINTFSFSSSVIASVSADSSSSILSEASSEMSSVSSQLSFLRKSLALMSMMSLRSLRQWVWMYRGSEQGTCSQTQSSFRSSWQIFISLIRQPLCSSSRFFNISPFFSSRSFREEKCCTSCTRTQRPLPHRSSKGYRPPSTCRMVSIIPIIILNHPSPSLIPRSITPFYMDVHSGIHRSLFPIFLEVALGRICNNGVVTVCRKSR